MPEPIIYNNKCFIDFFGELQINSKFILDLYVKGLNNIMKLFLDIDEDLGYEYKTGVLVVDKDKYFDVESQIKHKFQNIENSKTLVKKTYKLLNKIKQLNLEFESNIELKNLKSCFMKRYLDNFIDMMSLMVMQWLSFDLNIMSQISGLSNSDVSIFFSTFLYEPYQLRYNRKFNEVMLSPNKDNIELFIKEFAFLDKFDIDKAKTEDVDVLIEMANNYLEGDIFIADRISSDNMIKREKILREIVYKKNEEDIQRFYNNLILMRTATDEEEERHYQQARGVRNMRDFFALEKINIYSGFNEVLLWMKC